MKNSEEELEEISKLPEPSTSSAAAITTPIVRQKRLRAPIWARLLNIHKIIIFLKLYFV